MNNDFRLISQLCHIGRISLKADVKYANIINGKKQIRTGELYMKYKKIALSLAVCLMTAFTLTLTSCGNPYSGVEITDYIEVADYKAMKVEPVTVSVTDDELQTEINSRLEAEKTVEDVTKGTVEDGDTINIDYSGSINGVKFDGGEEEGRDLTIGSGTFIDGFESGLIGAEVGTTKNIKVTFPENYSQADLAGKDAVFAVKINSKQEEKIPELDEKFVKENSDVDTVEEYKAEVKKELTESKEQQANAEKRSEVWQDLVDQSKMKQDDEGNDLYPEEQLQEAIDETTAMYEEVAQSNNMTLDDYIEQSLGLDKETFNTQLEEYCKMQVKQEMIMYYIADQEDIDVSRSDYKNYIKEILAQYGYTEESYEEANGKSYEDVAGKDNIKAATLSEKVAQFVVDNGIENSQKESEKSKESK